MTARGEPVRGGRVALRATGNNKNSTRQLTVPAHMARLVPKDALFAAEFVDEGILFRFIGTKDDVDKHDMPMWADGGQA